MADSERETDGESNGGEAFEVTLAPTLAARVRAYAEAEGETPSEMIAALVVLGLAAMRPDADAEDDGPTLTI